MQPPAAAAVVIFSAAIERTDERTIESRRLRLADWLNDCCPVRDEFCKRKIHHRDINREIDREKKGGKKRDGNTW